MQLLLQMRRRYRIMSVLSNTTAIEQHNEPIIIKSCNAVGYFRFHNAVKTVDASDRY